MPRLAIQGNLQHQENVETFAYDQLASSLRSDIEDQARAIRKLLEDTTRHIIQVGLRLQFVRNRIGRENFQAWLRVEFQWSQPVASNYMAAARVFSDLDCIDLFQPSALFVLARRKVPQSARAEAIRSAENGEWITKSRAKAIVARHQTGREESTATAPREVTSRVRRYVESLLKKVPTEATPEVIAELLSIAEELKRRMPDMDQVTE